jgi:hypothetical protein
MARVSALDEYGPDLRRATVTLAVVAAHVALIIVMLRSTGHPTNVVDITLFALPIEPEDRRRVPVQEPPISPAAETASRGAAISPQPATGQHVEPSLGEPPRVENDTLGDTVAAHAGAASEPVRPIDWQAEIETSVRVLEQRDNIANSRRSLDGPTRPASSADPQGPACPYEQCEAGWGESLGVFKSSLHSKAGRVETVPSDRPTLANGSQNTKNSEVILWVNNWCYNIIVSSDPQRRGAYNCVVPLGKTAARGDLFDHMHEGQSSQSHETEAPWISYGLHFGVAPDAGKAP